MEMYSFEKIKVFGIGGNPKNKKIEYMEINKRTILQ